MGTISDYKVKFYIADIYGPRKCISSVNEYLSDYISDFYNLVDSNNLLSDINSVLNGHIPKCGGASRSLIYAIHEVSQTRIYSHANDYYENNSILPDYVLPTADFKQILKKWKEFLEKV